MQSTVYSTDKRDYLSYKLIDRPKYSSLATLKLDSPYISLLCKASNRFTINYRI
jgi:hypothetical protein